MGQGIGDLDSGLTIIHSLGIRMYYPKYVIRIAQNIGLYKILYRLNEAL